MAAAFALTLCYSYAVDDNTRENMPSKKHKRSGKLAPWCDTSRESMLQTISTCKEKLGKHHKLSSFCRDKAVATSVGILSMEGTWPGTSVDQKLQVIMQGIWKNGNPDYFPEGPGWDAEGGGSMVANEQQVVQGMLALTYLWNLPDSEVLTEAIVRHVHHILMNRATSGGDLMPAGQFRTTTCHSSGTGTVFCPPEDIERRLKRCLEIANGGNVDSRNAADFCHQFLMVHPFVNGNGRMARLLLCWVVRKDGHPFPVSIGHGKSGRKHWIRALTHRDKHLSEDGLNWLEALILDSCMGHWTNFSQLFG